VQGQWRILCRDGSRQLADRIWPGHAASHQGVQSPPLLRPLLEQRPIELIDDQPALTSDLALARHQRATSWEACQR